MIRHADTADIERFLRLTGSPEPFPENEFRSKRLDFFRAVVAELAAQPADTNRDELVCDKLVTTLIAGKRFFDVASLYAAVKKRHGDPASGHELHTAYKTVLLRHIREIFAATLTYHSPELDTLFCETLGDDRERFLELLGHLFEERRLYTMRLSPNIQKMFYTIADENVRRFVQFSNIHFLAFYLGALRNLVHVTPVHIEKWVSLILSPSTNRDIIEKLLNAIQINPAVDFLLLFLLLPRDEQRSVVLSLLRTTLERRPHTLRENRDALVFFLTRTVSSQFYDFHRIPQDQKVSLSNLILFAADEGLFEMTLAALREPNLHADAKQTETKKIFVQLLGKWGEREPRRLSALRVLLRGETLEESVRQEIIRVLRGVPQQEEKTMVSPLYGGPAPTPTSPPATPKTGRTQESPLHQEPPPLLPDDVDPDEKTLISPMFGGDPRPPEDPPQGTILDEDGEEATLVDRRPRNK